MTAAKGASGTPPTRHPKTRRRIEITVGAADEPQSLGDPDGSVR